MVVIKNTGPTIRTECKCQVPDSYAEIVRVFFRVAAAKLRECIEQSRQVPQSMDSFVKVHFERNGAGREKIHTIVLGTGMLDGAIRFLRQQGIETNKLKRTDDFGDPLVDRPEIKKPPVSFEDYTLLTDVQCTVPAGYMPVIEKFLEIATAELLAHLKNPKGLFPAELHPFVKLDFKSSEDGGGKVYTLVLGSTGLRDAVFFLKKRGINVANLIDESPGHSQPHVRTSACLELSGPDKYLVEILRALDEQNKSNGLSDYRYITLRELAQMLKRKFEIEISWAEVKRRLAELHERDSSIPADHRDLLYVAIKKELRILVSGDSPEDYRESYDGMVRGKLRRHISRRKFEMLFREVIAEAAEVPAYTAPTK